MPIPEQQLETWAKQGAIAGSRDTYAIVKRTLEEADTEYAGKSYEVFLQGSYCNDTNVYAESDVDVVICLNSVFYHDLTNMTTAEQTAFQSAFANGTYTLAEFKTQVLNALRKRFGATVKPDPKAIKIPADGARRNADVIVAASFRRYYRFMGFLDQSYEEGVCFWNDKGERIANYPKQHSKNCTTKHQATNSWFKPAVRILKNMRQRLVNNNEIEKSTAPSYFLEGLLYNVPNHLFGKTYQLTFLEAITWILNQDTTKLECANGQYYLLRDTNVTWSPEKYNEFMKAVINLWETW